METKLQRPQTPHIRIGTNSEESNVIYGNRKDNIFKNFSNFMKQIIDNKNENFLNGNIHLIDYLLSKYLNIFSEDVPKLEKISIQINGEYNLLNQFGERLVNLIVLKLNGSFIQNINELGSNFTKLKVLEMNNCHLKDLSGMICFQSLEVFEAKHNLINDLIELEMCSSIVKLDLEDNKIEKKENILFLSGLENLEELNLKSNPIQDYENEIKETIPTIKVLDGVRINGKDDEETANINVNVSSDNKNSNTNIEPQKETQETEQEKNGLSQSISCNITGSTNSNSPIVNGRVTKKEFYPSKINIEQDTTNILAPLNREMNMSKTMTQFRSKGKSNINETSSSTLFNKAPEKLNPIVKKKEESVQIKKLRETFKTSTQQKISEKQDKDKFVFLGTANKAGKKLDKIIVTKK